MRRFNDSQAPLAQTISFFLRNVLRVEVSFGDQELSNGSGATDQRWRRPRPADQGQSDGQANSGIATTYLARTAVCRAGTEPRV
ncbi:MAG TPA: hypothetical protein DEF42_16905 [Desulfosporosinus sp.]|nr:hypothetical protein [Desulfosporosinus sp.]